MTDTITLTRTAVAEAEELHRMQVCAFAPLLKKYKDTDTNPAAETLEKVQRRLATWDIYWILQGAVKIGSFRVLQREDKTCFLSALFLLPKYQGHGFAQQAVQLAEKNYPAAKCWQLDTIREELKLLHLYTKLGYRLTSVERKINPSMTLVGLDKQIRKEDSDADL